MLARFSISSSIFTVRLLSIISMGVRSDLLRLSFEPEFDCGGTGWAALVGDFQVLKSSALNDSLSWLSTTGILPPDVI